MIGARTRIAALTAMAVACVHSAMAGAPAAQAASTGSVFVALTSYNQVSIYAAPDGLTPIGQITAGVLGPISLCTDLSGDLFVLNNDNTITFYTSGTTTPGFTYRAGLNNPRYIALGPDGSLYASNAGSSTVVQYLPYSGKPSRIIGFSAPPAGVALDRAGNLFVITGAGDIEEFAPGSTSGTSLGFALINQPGQLGFDASGNFVVEELQAAIVIYAKAAPHAQLYAYSFPVGPPSGFALSADGESLYATDTSEGRVVRIAYPEGNFANVIDGAYGSYGAVAVTPPISH